MRLSWRRSAWPRRRRAGQPFRVLSFVTIFATRAPQIFKRPGRPPLRPPVPLLFGELVVRPAICYLVTDFFRGAAAKHPSLAAEANLPSSDMNRT